MSQLSNKVLVVGMDGLRFDRLRALRPPVLTSLMSAGVYGTSLLPYGGKAAPRTESPGEIVPEPPAELVTPGERVIRARTSPEPLAEPAPPGERVIRARTSPEPLAEPAPPGERVIRAWTDSPEPAAGPVSPGERVIRARTDSGPGWSSIASAVWPDKHGVVDNGFAGAQFAKYPDFLTRAQAARPDLSTAAFFSWAALDEHGAFSRAIGHRLVLDGFALTFAGADKLVAAEAERHLAESGPDLSFVYLGDTDEVAHELGPFCPEYTAALMTQDAALGRFLDAIRTRPSYSAERWSVLVTTDHGHVDEGGHGGASDEERTVFVIAARLGADLGGRPLPRARLVDVGPTALAELGIPVDPAWDLDGEPLLR